MAGTAVLGRLTWRVAEVVDVVAETARVASIVLSAPGWPGSRPGQHVDLRLTAEDGYSVERSYSIASDVGEQIAITVERIDDGEVSPYLVGELRPGDRLELRGPVGGYFTWLPAMGGPLQLVAGGSGIVPLAAMLRHRATLADRPPARLVYSARSLPDVIYRAELDRLAAGDDGFALTYTLTRERPAEWPGLGRRIDRAMLGDIAWASRETPLVFVCGPTAMVETVATALVELGHPPERVRTERFGPTGA